jgi:methionyl-tRNA formyltransferase
MGATEMGNIDWETQTAQDILRIQRALGDTFGTHTRYNLNQQIVRLLTLNPPQKPHISYANPELFEGEYKPGMLKYDWKQKLLFIKCLENQWLSCSHLQIQGKRALTAEQFVNGYCFRSLKRASEVHRFVKI